MYSFCCIPQSLESFEPNPFIKIVNTGIDIPSKTLILCKRQRIDYYFLYVAEGKIYCERENETYTLNKGDIFLYFPNDKQCRTTYPTDNTTIYWVHFMGDYVNELINSLRLTPGAYCNLHNPKIYETLHELIDEYTKTPPYYEQIGIQKVITLLTLLARTYNKEDKVLLPEINKVIFDNPNITNSELAERYHISQSTLLRYFKIKYKITLSEYKQSVIINRAKDLLKNTTETTISIATLLGFDDVYNFYHFFKRYTGVTASEYRKNHRPQNTTND